VTVRRDQFDGHVTVHRDQFDGHVTVRRDQFYVIKCEVCIQTYEFDGHVTVRRDQFRIIKPTRCTNFSNLFRNEILHFSGSSSVHHQEYFTVHTAMVYVIQVCAQLARRIRMERVPS